MVIFVHFQNYFTFFQHFIVTYHFILRKVGLFIAPMDFYQNIPAESKRWFQYKLIFFCSVIFLIEVTPHHMTDILPVIFLSEIIFNPTLLDFSYAEFRANFSSIIFIFIFLSLLHFSILFHIANILLYILHLIIYLINKYQLHSQ